MPDPQPFGQDMIDAIAMASWAETMRRPLRVDYEPPTFDVEDLAKLPPFRTIVFGGARRHGKTYAQQLALEALKIGNAPSLSRDEPSPGNAPTLGGEGQP